MTHSTNCTRSAGTLRTYRSPGDTVYEEWRPIVGFEGRYEVSDQGRVRPAPGVGRGRVLKLHPGRNSYFEVCFYVGYHQRRTLTVHRLVCEAFHGPRPSAAHLVRHLNDERQDNRAVNLAWGTYADNSADALRNGRNPEAKRDACHRGHPYVDGNYSITRGWRRCLVCHRDKERARMAAKRAAA